MKLIELDAKIKTCLCLEKADTELCLTLLDELLGKWLLAVTRGLGVKRSSSSSCVLCCAIWGAGVFRDWGDIKRGIELCLMLLGTGTGVFRDWGDIRRWHQAVSYAAWYGGSGYSGTGVIIEGGIKLCLMLLGMGPGYSGTGVMLEGGTELCFMLLGTGDLGDITRWLRAVLCWSVWGTRDQGIQGLG